MMMIHAITCKRYETTIQFKANTAWDTIYTTGQEIAQVNLVVSKDQDTDVIAHTDIYIHIECVCYERLFWSV